MKRRVTIVSGLIAVAAFVGVIGVLATPAVQAKSAQPKATIAAKDTASKASVKDVTYTAGEGDSYTQMVRKAVQTYGINQHVNLGNARIVYIETMMTQAAGNPYLWIGQKVTIKGSDVKTWADKSQKLSDSDLAAWQTYVPFIDFNTNEVGRG